MQKDKFIHKMFSRVILGHCMEDNMNDTDIPSEAVKLLISDERRKGTLLVGQPVTPVLTSNFPFKTVDTILREMWDKQPVALVVVLRSWFDARFFAFQECIYSLYPALAVFLLRCESTYVNSNNYILYHNNINIHVCSLYKGDTLYLKL